MSRSSSRNAGLKAFDHGERVCTSPPRLRNLSEEVRKAVKKGSEDALFFTPEAALKRLKKLGDLYASNAHDAPEASQRLPERLGGRTTCGQEQLQ